jgi:hypothetical protein
MKTKFLLLFSIFNLTYQLSYSQISIEESSKKYDDGSMMIYISNQFYSSINDANLVKEWILLHDKGVKRVDVYDKNNPNKMAISIDSTSDDNEIQKVIEDLYFQTLECEAIRDEIRKMNLSKEEWINQNEEKYKQLIRCNPFDSFKTINK